MSETKRNRQTNADVDIYGVEELVKTVDKMARRYSSDAKVFVNTFTDTLRKRIVRHASGDLVNVVTGTYKKSWKTNAAKEYTRGDTHYLVGRAVSTTAPHAHLIESGHELYIHGNATGKKVAGHYVLKTSLEETQSAFSGEAGEIIDAAIKEWGGLR